MIKKTNAARLLDQAGIAYKLISYTVDEKNLAATHVAQELGENIEQVYKTLVLHGDRNGYFVCVVPGNREIDLKKAASASGNKKAEMIAMKDLLPITGYIRGGCSPIGMKKSFPTYFQKECMQWECIFVSAGVRGVQIAIAPGELVKYVKGLIADITMI